MIRGILLDLDGTFIDSNESHARAWAEALEEAGIPADLHAIRAKIGEGGDHLLPELTGIDWESELGKKVDERRGEIFREDFLPHLRAFAGARGLLQQFRKAGLRFVAATSASKEDCELLLAQAGLADLITEFTTASDAAASKPAPEIIEMALKKIKLAPGEVLMLGDTPYDIEAANRAGVETVAFTCGGWPREKLAGAVAVYQGPWDLLARFERSPFVRVAQAA